MCCHSQMTYWVWSPCVNSWEWYPKLLVHDGSVVWVSRITEQTSG